MRIVNIELAYKYFLELVNKVKTHVVKPDEFNLDINTAMINWAKERIILNEVNQERIEDLNVLFVDGSYPGRGISFEGDYASIPDESMYNVRAVFDVEYKNSPCYPDGIGSKQIARLVKSDRLSAILQNYYERPMDSRLLWFLTENKAKLLTGKESGLSDTIPKVMYLDYYKYPDTLAYVEGGNNESPLQFKAVQMQEIVERAAQEFLEKNRDPRYQSYLNEQIQRK